MKEYIKPSVIRVRDESGTFIPVAAIRGEKGESGGPMWVRYADNADGINFTVDWHKGQNYIGIMLDEDPSEDPSDYNWVELPKGETGPAGIAGTKGDKGDSIRFAYAHEPYKRDTINQNGSIETVYNNDYSVIWESGMTWIGIYAGIDEPANKKYYTWIQLPKGEPGSSSVSIVYGKGTVNYTAESHSFREFVKYIPTKNYYYEYGREYTVANYVGTDKRFTNFIALTDTKTILTRKQIYSAYDNVDLKRVYVALNADRTMLQFAIEWTPDKGWFEDTNSTVDSLPEGSTIIVGAITISGRDGTIYAHTVGTQTRYYQEDILDNKRVYRVLKNVNKLVYFTVSNSCWSKSKADAQYDVEEQKYIVVKDYESYPVYKLTNSSNTRYALLMKGSQIRNGVTDSDGTEVATNSIAKNITYYWLVDKIDSNSPTDHNDFAYYIPTDIRLENVDISSLRVHYDISLTTGDSPVYSYTEFPEGYKDDQGNWIAPSPITHYGAVYSKLTSYDDLEVFDKYSDDADYMGVYFGNKDNPIKSDYQWLKIKGSTGRTGGPVYIRYAKTNTKGGVALVDIDSIAETWLGHDYNWIGIGVGDMVYANDYGEGNNEDDSIYTWIPILRGIAGEKGDTGPAGKDGKPSAMLFRYSPFSDGINPDTGEPYMFEYRGPTDIYIGICKTAYYDPDTNQAVTDADEPDNYLWLELPDTDTIKTYGQRIGEVDGRTWVDTERLDLDSGEMVPSSEPVNQFVKDLSTKVDEFTEDHVAIQRNLESYRLTSRKNDNANIDKLNVAVGYMRELLKRIRTLEAQHPILPSSGSIELPYFDYSNVEAENTPTNTSFSAHVKLNSNSRYDIYYMSTMCTNDSTVWVKLKAGYSSILSTDEVYLYRVPLDPTEETVKVQLSDSAYTTSDGYYWYLLLKSSTEDQLLAPLNTTVPESLYDYLMIEKDKPADA